MISIYFSDTYISESNGFRAVRSSTSKKEIVHLIEDVLIMIEGILVKQYHYDYTSNVVHAYIVSSAMLASLLNVYDVCPKARLVNCIFDYVSHVAVIFADEHDFISFVLNENGEFTFNY